MFSRPRFGALSAARHAAQPFPSASTNGSRLASYTRGPQQRRFHGELYLRLAGDKYGSEQWHRRHRANRSLRPLHVTRGKKTKSTVKLSDLPQGAIRLDDRPVSSSPEDGGASNGRGGGPAYPTVVLQAKQNMQRFENCVLLTRVGGFYELYFEHAEDYGPMLNLKVAQKKTTAGPVPMAGFPFFQLDRFLKVLVQDLNRYVAIAEEFPNSVSDRVKSGGLMHDRRVARIVTPGTLIDENFMDPYANNYIMAIHVIPQDQHPTVKASRDMTEISKAQPMETVSLGLAWLDLSTGHFFTQATDMASLSTILSRVGPREVVLDREVQSKQNHALFSVLAEDRQLITYAPPGPKLELTDWAPMLESEMPDGARETFSDGEITAGSLLLHYVKDRLQGLSMKLQPPLRYENMHVMNIDKNSMRALEIKQTVRDGFFRGSLLHAVRRTVTRSGARLLNEWLSAPSTSLDLIKTRLDLVESFIQQDILREGIVIRLGKSSDSQRLVQKFTLGRGNADDLVALANTILTTESIVRLLGQYSRDDGGSSHSNCLASIANRIQLDGPSQLAEHIKDAIDEEGVHHHHELEDLEAGQMMALAEEVVSSEGSTEDAASLPKGKRKRRPASIKEYYGEDSECWIMKPHASPTLQKLHKGLTVLTDEKAALEEMLRTRFKAQSLTLKWTPQLGHICYVKGKDAQSKHLADVRAISSSRSTRSFHLPEWTQLGQRLDQTRLQIRGEETGVFHKLRQDVVKNLVRLRRNAAVLDELDIATSFASLAQEQNLVRPVLNNSTAHNIIGGRHPTVEGGLQEQGVSFMRNDCMVGAPPAHGRLWLITGPNMAGKSTFLRQNALITILAQVGCYVPASYAELGIVDAIFSRVGSADNLYRDQSTFMVEMLETAHILRTATPRSFVIMDEIGRGTTPEDGTAVAFAALHHLATVNRCRALFATHFHAVADLAQAAGLCSPSPPGDGTETETEKPPAVEMYCTDVQGDEQGGFVYVHKLRKGINRKSHALKVARLAGLPDQAIRMAEEVLLSQAETLDVKAAQTPRGNGNTSSTGGVSETTVTKTVEHGG